MWSKRDITSVVLMDSHYYFMSAVWEGTAWWLWNNSKVIFTVYMMKSFILENENYHPEWNKRYCYPGASILWSQQTQNICITFVQCRPNVSDVGPTLYKCYTNVLCLLGYYIPFLLSSKCNVTVYDIYMCFGVTGSLVEHPLPALSLWLSPGTDDHTKWLIYCNRSTPPKSVPLHRVSTYTNTSRD